MLLEALLNAVNGRKNRLLDIAQAALPESQYQAFRRLFLNEFGRNGLEGDLERIIAEREKHRNG